MSNIRDYQKRKIIISGSDHVGRLLVKFYHSGVKHQGRLFTEGILRSNGYWITGARRLISSVTWMSENDRLSCIYPISAF